MRLLVYVLMLALSGVVNAAAAAPPLGSAPASSSSATPTEEPAADHGCGGCDDEEEAAHCDGPCSPLCKNCVCSLGARTVPSAPIVVAAPQMVGTFKLRVAGLALPPRAPALDDVFHPPRI